MRPVTQNTDTPDSADSTVEVQAGGRVTIALDLAKFVEVYYGDLDTHTDQVTHAVAKMIEPDINRDVRKKVDDEIGTKVGEIVTEAISEPFRVVGPYGQDTGKVTSLKELIMEEVSDWLSKPIRDGYNRSTGQTALQAFIRSEVNRVLENELRVAVADAKKEVVEAVRSKASEVITETIARTVKI